MNIRTIKINWRNQRAIKRIYRWLDMGADFKGFLWKKGEIIGYKTMTKDCLCFNFYKKN